MQRMIDGWSIVAPAAFTGQAGRFCSDQECDSNPVLLSFIVGRPHILVTTWPCSSRMNNLTWLMITALFGLALLKSLMMRVWIPTCAFIIRSVIEEWGALLLVLAPEAPSALSLAW